MLDGFGVTANLYGRYAETYIHHETDVSNDDEIEVDEHKSGKTSFNHLDLVNFSYLWTLGPAKYFEHILGSCHRVDTEYQRTLPTGLSQ